MNHENAALKDTLRVFVVPTEILDVEGLTTHEKMVYIVLRSYANGQDNTVFPSYPTIAKKASMSKRKAIQCVQKLEELGLLVKEERLKVNKNGGISPTSNLYYLYRPAEVQGVVNNVHQGSESHSPGVVNNVHQGSESGAPENNHLKEQDLKIKNKDRERDLLKAAEIDSELKEYIETRLNEFQDKKIDLETVLNWIEANAEFYNYSEFAAGINQLLEFPESIGNVIRFLNRTFADIDRYLADYRKKQQKKITREIANQKKDKPVQEIASSQTGSVPFYNWLEQ